MIQTLPEDLLTEGVLTRRLLAFLIDALLVTTLCGALFVVLLALGLLTLGLSMPLLGLLPGVPAAYNWLSLASPMQATPGQRLLGLVVVRAADLAPPTLLEALVWTVGFLVTVSLGAIWLAAAIVLPRHRTLHDIVSGLLVVRSRALTAPVPVWNPPSGGPSYV